MSCLVDSNIVIYFLNRQLPAPARTAVESAVLAGATYASITRIEVLGWRGHTAASKTRARELLREMREIALTDAVIESVISLRETYRVRLPDAIIAASAITANLPLMTHNTQDFKRIKQLSLVDPFEKE